MLANRERTSTSRMIALAKCNYQSLGAVNGRYGPIPIGLLLSSRRRHKIQNARRQDEEWRMRNRLRIFVALCFVGMTFCLPTWAQLTAGQVERQKGSASRSTDGVTSKLAPGSQIFVGDEISTGQGARLLIRFDNETKLTLGENARITIDQFVYAPGGRGSIQSPSRRSTVPDYLGCEPNSVY